MLLSCRQCRQFDRIAIEEYGMPGIVLMENAGVACTQQIFQHCMDQPTVILCGSGNNGGDGFVIARHLANAKVPVSVVLMAEPTKILGDAKINYDVLGKMDTSISRAETSWTEDDFLNAFRSLSDDPLIVDAMLGTGAKGPLREPYTAAVKSANRMSARRVAIDIPTGLDADTGETELAFMADLTCSFIARKTGFENQNAQQWLGKVEVIDIGAPHEILGRL